MMNKENIFPVVNKAFEQHKDTRKALADGTYYNELGTRMLANHSPLMAYVNNVCLTEEPEIIQAYARGALHMYDIVSRNLTLTNTEISLTQGDMRVHEINYYDQEYLLFNKDYWHDISELEEAIGNTTLENGLSQFFNLLEQSSPTVYQEYAQIIIDPSCTMDQRRGFTRGLYDVYMPFYRKMESEELYDQLIFYPGLAGAFDRGYYKRD